MEKMGDLLGDEVVLYITSDGRNFEESNAAAVTEGVVVLDEVKLMSKRNGVVK